MTRIGLVFARTVVVGGLGLGLAASAAAQDGRAGTVTSLQGTADVRRVSATSNTPQVQPLKFKDAVLVKDQITTGDQSLVRILLGGRAVVTVRERSSLTISETENVATIDITRGKIAMSVAKDRMRANERIDIKTPNAVAGVRGTIVITEVSGPPAAAGSLPGNNVTTNFTLLTGLLEVTILDPSGRPGSARFMMNPLQSLGITGFTPPPGPRNITVAQGQAAANDYKVNLKDAPPGTTTQITDRQVQAATNAAAGVTDGSLGGGSLIGQVTHPAPPTSPVGALPSGCGISCTDSKAAAPPPPPPPPPVAPPQPPPNQCQSICEGGGGVVGGLGRAFRR
jgi:FecR protein